MVTPKSPCRIQQGHLRRGQRKQWARVRHSLGPGARQSMPCGIGRGSGLLRSGGSSTILPGDGCQPEMGLRLIAENPELSRADMAREGVETAFKRQPMLPFHLGGRLGVSLAPWLLLAYPAVAAFCHVWRCLSRTGEGSMTSSVLLGAESPARLLDKFPDGIGKADAVPQYAVQLLDRLKVHLFSCICTRRYVTYYSLRYRAPRSALMSTAAIRRSIAWREES